jgi:hypothetical protein
MNDNPQAEGTTLSRVVIVSELDASGAEYSIEANASERHAVAARLDLPALGRLTGKFRLTPMRGGVEIRLALEAEAERTCVVSLDPMSQALRESVTMQFLHAYDPETDIEEDEVIRETLDGDEIDLGELLVQFLSLSLDPYPRKSSAEPLLEKYRDATSTSPFEALKGLVDRDQ